jgi:hypothetical protein
MPATINGRNKEADEIGKNGRCERSALGAVAETAGIAREDIRTNASCHGHASGEKVGVGTEKNRPFSGRSVSFSTVPGDRRNPQGVKDSPV